MGTSSIEVKSKKSKSLWICRSCGAESHGYMGKCGVCNSWGSIEEKIISKKSSADAPKNSLFLDPEKETLSLDQIQEESNYFYQTSSEEFNRVLGGGIVPGSLVLLGGHPGIGKSTLLLQVAADFAQKSRKVFYTSAEESSQQLKLRAKRLLKDEITSTLPLDDTHNHHQEHKTDPSKEYATKQSQQWQKNFLVSTENNLEKLIAKIKKEAPEFIIIDSIQAMYMPLIDSIPGSITQIRECCSNLMRLAKNTGIPILVVGHINKEGDLAGPKVLEHMVDTVLLFEGSKDANSNIRILRSIKNRFGNTNEIALFEMNITGLRDVKNAAELFLDQRSSGIITASLEGNRVLLLEIQSLVLGSEYSNPRRLANGIELNRLHQILAILEKKMGVAFSKADAYLNVIGGLQIKEPSSDLAVALSLYLNLQGKTENEEELLVLGELGLNGEVRAVSNIESRIREAAKLGFAKAIIPESNYKKSKELKLMKGIELIRVKNLAESIGALQVGH